MSTREISDWQQALSFVIEGPRKQRFADRECTFYEAGDGLPGKAKVKRGGKSLDFRFLFAILAGGRGNGKRLAAPLPHRLSRAAGRLICFPAGRMAMQPEMPLKRPEPDLVPAAPSGGSDGALLRSLRGVPKAALQAVLGKELGERAWQKARGPVEAVAELHDEEVVEGLIAHLSRLAARTLREEARQARSVSLYATHADGTVCSGNRRLSGLTQDPAVLFEEGRILYERLPKRAAQLANLELRVSSIAAETLAERSEAAWRRLAAALGAA